MEWCEYLADKPYPNSVICHQLVFCSVCSMTSSFHQLLQQKATFRGFEKTTSWNCNCVSPVLTGLRNNLRKWGISAKINRVQRVLCTSFGVHSKFCIEGLVHNDSLEVPSGCTLVQPYCSCQWPVHVSNAQVAVHAFVMDFPHLQTFSLVQRNMKQQLQVYSGVISGISFFPKQHLAPGFVSVLTKKKDTY